MGNLLVLCITIVVCLALGITLGIIVAKRNAKK